MIVTTLDTFTSLLSGFTIFGILGNLAKELDTEVENVVGSGGTGLAFISYPDAIAKTFLPQVNISIDTYIYEINSIKIISILCYTLQLQLFSVLFFLMMTVLGVGSSVALLSTINTLLLDSFPHVRVTYLSAFSCSCGFLAGLVYVTPVSTVVKPSSII